MKCNVFPPKKHTFIISMQITNFCACLLLSNWIRKFIEFCRWILILGTCNITISHWKEFWRWFFFNLTLFSFIWPPDAFKRVNVVKWNFLTFPKYQKQKFWTQFEFKFLNPTGGGIRKEVIKKFVRGPILQNMILKLIKIRINQEDELFILKIKRVMVIFVNQVGQNLNLLKNSNLKISLSFLD